MWQPHEHLLIRLGFARRTSGGAIHLIAGMNADEPTNWRLTLYGAAGLFLFSTFAGILLGFGGRFLVTHL